MSTVYRDLGAAAVEEQYQPSLRVPSLGPFIEAYRTEGEAARAASTHERRAYGDHPDEWMWYFPAAEPDAPLLVFIHGGYWRRLSGDDGCFLAPAAHRLGLALASVNYTLCPAAPLATLVDQTERALTALLDPTGPLEHDRRRIHVAGHSAGAHLTATAIVAGLPLAGAVLVSGIFDITPIVHTTINVDVGLDDREAARLSPLFALGGLHRPGLAQIVTWSGGDTEEFARQGHDWVGHWSATEGNRRPEIVIVEDRNHFDIVFDLLDADRPLGRAVIDQVTTGQPAR